MAFLSRIGEKFVVPDIFSWSPEASFVLINGMSINGHALKQSSHPYRRTGIAACVPITG